MYTTEQLLTRYKTWDEERAKLHERDGNGENPVAAGDWHDSDDEGAELAVLLLSLIHI